MQHDRSRAKGDSPSNRYETEQARALPEASAQREARSRQCSGNSKSISQVKIYLPKLHTSQTHRTDRHWPLKKLERAARPPFLFLSRFSAPSAPRTTAGRSRRSRGGPPRPWPRTPAPPQAPPSSPPPLSSPLQRAGPWRGRSPPPAPGAGRSPPRTPESRRSRARPGAARSAPALSCRVVHRDGGTGRRFNDHARG